MEILTMEKLTRKFFETAKMDIMTKMLKNHSI